MFIPGFLRTLQVKHRLQILSYIAVGVLYRTAFLRVSTQTVPIQVHLHQNAPRAKIQLLPKLANAQRTLCITQFARNSPEGVKALYCGALCQGTVAIFVGSHTENAVSIVYAIASSCM